MRINPAATLILWVVGICELSAQPPCSHSRAIEAAARKAVDVDMTTLNDMKVGFMLNASVLDDWAKMAEEQQRALRTTAIFNLIQAAAAPTFLPVKAGKINLPNGMASLSTAQAQAMYKMLGNNGVEDPILENLIQQASSLSGKPEAADAGLKILDRLSLMTQSGIAAFGEDKIEALAPVAQLGLILMGPAYAGYALALGSGSSVLTLIQAEFVERPAQEGQTKWLTSANEAALVQLKSQMTKLQKDLQSFHAASAQLDSCEHKSGLADLVLTGLWSNCKRDWHDVNFHPWQVDAPPNDVDMRVDQSGMPSLSNGRNSCVDFGPCVYSWTKTAPHRYECHSGDNVPDFDRITGVLEIQGRTMRVEIRRSFNHSGTEIDSDHISVLTKKQDYICQVSHAAQTESGRIGDAANSMCQVACFDASSNTPLPKPVDCN